MHTHSQNKTVSTLALYSVMCFFFFKRQICIDIVDTWIIRPVLLVCNIVSCAATVKKSSIATNYQQIMASYNNVIMVEIVESISLISTKLLNKRKRKKEQGECSLLNALPTISMSVTIYMNLDLDNFLYPFERFPQGI